VTTVRCGTNSGYQKHRTDRTTPCLPCKDAWRDYSADWRVRTGRVKNASVPYTVLGLLFTWVPDHILRQAEAELGEAMVQRAIDARHRARKP
jgi:hypothetical protein